MGLKSGETGCKAVFQSQFPGAFLTCPRLEDVRQLVGVERSETLAVLDGNVMRDMAVYHYAMLPPHHPEFISRDHRGLPRGSFKLSASLDPLKFPPHGTVAWAQDLVESSLPYSDDRHTITLKTVKALFQIKCEEQSPAARRHNRWVRENLDFTWTQALEEQLSGMELNYTNALDAQ